MSSTGAPSTTHTRVLQFLCKLQVKKDGHNNGHHGVQRSIFTVPKWRNWQTRMVQVHVLARVWGFESPPRHQRFTIPPAMSNLREGFFV